MIAHRLHTIRNAGFGLSRWHDNRTGYDCLRRRVQSDVGSLHRPLGRRPSINVRIRKLLGEKESSCLSPLRLCRWMLSSVSFCYIVIHLLDGARLCGLSSGMVSVIIRLVIYRNAYYLCFVRGAEMCGKMRLSPLPVIESGIVGTLSFFGTLTKSLSNFEATHTAKSIIKRDFLYLPLAGMCRVDHCRAHPCMGNRLLEYKNSGYEGVQIS